MKYFLPLIIALSILISPINTLAEELILAGGSFWCLEHDLESLEGINFVQSGYSGGDLQNPTYENHEEHQEVVLVNYDSQLVSLSEILRFYLRNIDPLDGTKDFIQGTSNYAMHLALNYKNKPIMGIVLIPEKDQLWISNVENVWCEKRDGSLIKLNPPHNKNLKEMVLVTSKNHRNPTLKNLIQKIDFKEVIIMGSIGCKVTSIIRGESDIYICLSLPGKSSPKDWDFAAPAAILKAAGGEITNLDNKELSYGKAGFEQGGIIVATNNKKTHGSICLEIKKIIEDNRIYPL